MSRVGLIARWTWSPLPTNKSNNNEMIKVVSLSFNCHFKYLCIFNTLFFIFDKCLHLMHKVTFPFCDIIISHTDHLPMQEYILKFDDILWLLLILQSSPAYLLEELFLWLLNNNSVSIAHHGYQHVQQEDGDQDLEQHKHSLRHCRVGTRVKIIILENVWKMISSS